MTPKVSSTRERRLLIAAAWPSRSRWCCRYAAENRQSLKEDDDIEAATQRMHEMKAQSKGQSGAGAQSPAMP